MSTATGVTPPPQGSADRAAAPDEGASRAGTPVSSTIPSVRAARPEDDAALEALARELGGSLFQRPAWRRAVQSAFGHEPADWIALDGERPVGFLPMMHCKGLSGGAHLISSPYGVYGGPVAGDVRVVRALIDAGLAEARRRRVGRLELRSRGPLEHPELVSSDLYVTFVKDLPPDPDEVLGAMKKDERRLVRRAADSHGLELDEGSWFVEDLARLFHASKQRLGSPGLPLRWFEALLRELGDDAVVHIVRRGSEVLAASMCFIDQGALCMYYIGTTPEANRTYAATSFMIAELQKWAIARGLTVFDLGRSRRDAGAVKFKRNQGFVAAPLHYAYGLVRAKGLPSFTPSNPRTRVLRETWARMPGWLCRRVSGRAARFLP